LEKFKKNYETIDDFVVPGSFKELMEKHNYIMGSLVAFKKSEDNLKIEFK